MRSDARQQKGMVAINKKQLATNEGERDKIKNEMADLSKAAEENLRNLQQSQNVASPATSTASHNTNPFFPQITPANNRQHDVAIRILTGSTSQGL